MKIKERIEGFLKEWENLKGFLIQQTGNLTKMGVEDLLDLRLLFSKLEEEVPGVRKNFDEIMKIKVKPNETISTRFGTLKHVYYEYDQYDYQGMREYLKEKGELDKFYKGKGVRDYIALYKTNGNKKIKNNK